jgi:site-specific recombinase XerD
MPAQRWVLQGFSNYMTLNLGLSDRTMEDYNREYALFHNFYTDRGIEPGGIGVSLIVEYLSKRRLGRFGRRQYRQGLLCP